ncbi:alpha/beta hydrolase [Trichocoleus sp. FACHB-262]|uniref:alpha/beta hydrolase n=1 Tax=Trichocoleus sp. FACHB-262 TaxID=2692869 RepID=UPI001F5491EA|nr:alpha/beta hydrolase [Trichocoleus sp. FACHB-262]
MLNLSPFENMPQFFWPQPRVASSPAVHSALPQRYQRWMQGLLCSAAVALSCSIASPSHAAERLTLRLGPFQQTIAIADLEEFAKTGKLSPALKPYALVLTPDIRKALADRLELDPNIGDQVVNELLRSPAGQRMLAALGVAIPGSNVEQLQAAITLAARQVDGLSVLAILRAFPQETVTVDVTSIAALASQLNFSYWESQALSPILERELKVDSAFTAAFDPTVPGPQVVEQKTLVLRDRQRQRTLPVDLYWSDRPSGPLVVLSHGFGANRTFLAYLARHLASYGLTVAAIEHPGSNMAWLASPSPGQARDTLLSAAEFVERPRDVSFLLDQLAQLNQKPGALRGKLNTNQASVMGHSLGGYTALALAGAELNVVGLRQFCQEHIPLGLSPADWLQCTAIDLPERRVSLRDPRVVQAIALNPVIGRLFGPEGLKRVATPTLILTGTEDSLTPTLTHQLQPFAQLPNPKYLVTAIGGTHLSVGDPANFSDLITQSALVRERQGKETANLRQLLQGVSLAFIKQLTPEAKQYQPFLTSGYAQSLSTAQIPLRLNTKLPASLAPWMKVAALPPHQLNTQVNQQVSALAYYFVACNSVLYTVSASFGSSAWQLGSRRPGSG